MNPGVYKRLYPDGCTWWCAWDGEFWYRAAKSEEAAADRIDLSAHQELRVVQ